MKKQRTREEVIALAVYHLIKANGWKKIGIAKDMRHGEVRKIRNVYAAR
jgi:hypothetical protein